MLSVNIREKRFQTAAGSSLLAISHLEFSVADGEFVCLVGPSGCGKTTSLRILLGLDTDYDGQVHAGPGQLRPAVVFQEPRLLPWRTVEQNVRLVLSAGRRHDNLDGLFDALGLASLRSMYPTELSLGLARRVALARALAFEPSVLVLDEPFVSLDESTADRLRAFLLDTWQQRPIAVVMVTHNVSEALRMADRIVLLSARPGKVIGELPLSRPRAERDPVWLAQQMDEVMRLQ